MVCVGTGLCFTKVKQALEANKLIMSLTLSEIGFLDKGFYPAFMFIHVQYLLNYICFVYAGPGGGSVTKWLSTRLGIHCFHWP